MFKIGIIAYSSKILSYYGTATALSAARYDLAAASVGNYALFGGGYTGAVSDVVDAYDTSLVRTAPTALSAARYALAAASVGNYALFGGGYTTTYSAVVDVYQYKQEVNSDKNSKV